MVISYLPNTQESDVILKIAFRETWFFILFAAFELKWTSVDTEPGSKNIKTCWIWKHLYVGMWMCWSLCCSSISIRSFRSEKFRANFKPSKTQADISWSQFDPSWSRTSNPEDFKYQANWSLLRKLIAFEKQKYSDMLNIKALVGIWISLWEKSLSY